MKIQRSDVIGGTDVFNVTGNGFGHPVLVRIDFYRQADNSVLLTSCGGHTGTVFEKAKCVLVSTEEWDFQQRPPVDRAALTRWAFEKTGWVIRNNDF